MSPPPSDPAATPPAGLPRVQDLPAQDRPRAAPATSGTADAVVGCQTPREARDTRRDLRLRISVFFDGTGNNRRNVELGPTFHTDSSYCAGLTNIALLESAVLACSGTDVDEHVTVYVEGVGTEDGKNDRRMDMALGTGKTGIPAKIEVAFGKILASIGGMAQGRALVHVHLDSFGFSRGAATARSFLWAALDDPGRTLKERLERQGFKVGPVVSKFVGLFDTVASYNGNHGNDTQDLRLDAIRRAEKVVHLVAAEEHRSNFRLTNIASAGRKGCEVFLPGAHADVGGGYLASEDERWHILFDLGVSQTTHFDRELLQREYQWLVESGWYRPDELTVNEEQGVIEANRRGISNLYARIPLLMMADFARAHGIVIDPALNKSHAVPEDLRVAEAAILASAAGEAEAMGPWLTQRSAGPVAPWLADLRHRHLHFSAVYRSMLNVHQPSWSAGSMQKRQRLRVILAG